MWSITSTSIGVISSLSCNPSCSRKLSSSEAIYEPPRITQEYLRRQRRHRPHAWMRHQQPRSATLTSLLCDLLCQVFDFLFHLPVHLLQHAPSIRSMGQQRQEGDLGLPVVASQTRTSFQIH